MKRKILRRLDRLERMAGERNDRGRGDCRRRGDGHDHHGGDRRDGHDHHHGHDRCDGRDHHGHGHHDGRDQGGRGGGHDEKRVIDTIVRLVAERVGRIIQQEESSRGERAVREESSRGERADREDGTEKRVVDLVVRLVSERVEEIVAREFEQYLGMDFEGMEDDEEDCGHDHSHDQSIDVTPPEKRRAKPPVPPADED